ASLLPRRHRQAMGTPAPFTAVVLQKTGPCQRAGRFPPPPPRPVLRASLRVLLTSGRSPGLGFQGKADEPVALVEQRVEAGVLPVRLQEAEKRGLESVHVDPFRRLLPRSVHRRALPG